MPYLGLGQVLDKLVRRSLSNLGGWATKFSLSRNGKVRGRHAAWHWASALFAYFFRDTYMSLHQTAKKLGIKFLDYLKERNTGITPESTIAQLVQQRFRNASTTAF